MIYLVGFDITWDGIINDYGYATDEKEILGIIKKWHWDYFSETVVSHDIDYKSGRVTIKYYSEWDPEEIEERNFYFTRLDKFSEGDNLE